MAINQPKSRDERGASFTRAHERRADFARKGARRFPKQTPPGTIVYLESLDLDLLQAVCARLQGWAQTRGWQVTVSQGTLYPGNLAPSSSRFPFHDPLSWSMLGREQEWIQAHRRDLELFTEPADGTLHLQCSGWLRALACLRAGGRWEQAETLESVGAELPCPDWTFVLAGPFSPMLGPVHLWDNEREWQMLSRAFEAKVAGEIQSSGVSLLGAEVIEGNPGWGPGHYALSIQSVLERKCGALRL